MGQLTVVYDACVLFPAPLRDLLMHVALTDLYRAKWTDTIHEEWIRSVLNARSDLTRQQLERTRKLMDVHVRDCLVTGYEAMIENVTLPDPKDRHVVAAAIRAGANVIVTFNLKDFPTSALTPWNIEAQHPDTFLASQIDQAPHIVCAAARRHRESLKSPPKSVVDYLQTLEAQGLARTIRALKKLSELI